MWTRVSSIFVCLVLTECRVVDTKNKRTSCNIYDASSGTVSSRFCDTLPEHVNHYYHDVKKTEYFCHTVWFNVSDPGQVTGYRIKVLRQQCINNLGDGHNSCRDKVACVDVSDGRPPHSSAGETSVSKRILHCCCSQDNCNKDYHWSPAPQPETVTEPPVVTAPAHLSTWFLLLYTLVPLIVLSVIGAALYYVYYQRKNAQFGQLPNIDDTVDSAHPNSPSLLEIKARGRFGAV